MLKRVSRLPITQWDFKTDLDKHVGPMAQDFHAAFGLDGNDDRQISLTNMAGVSLAAIQAFSREMKNKDAEIANRKERLDVVAKETAGFSARRMSLEAQRPGGKCPNCQPEDAIAL